MWFAEQDAEALRNIRQTIDTAVADFKVCDGGMSWHQLKHSPDSVDARKYPGLPFADDEHITSSLAVEVTLVRVLLP